MNYLFPVDSMWAAEEKNKSTSSKGMILITFGIWFDLIEVLEIVSIFLLIVDLRIISDLIPSLKHFTSRHDVHICRVCVLISH